MARTTITAQAASASTPLTVAMAAVDAANGNQWVYTGRRRLLVHNGGGAPITLTLPTPAAVTVAGLDVPDRAVVIAAGGYAYVVESGEAKQADGMVYADWSDGTSVTAALIDD